MRERERESDVREREKWRVRIGKIRIKGQERFGLVGFMAYQPLEVI